MFSRNLEDFHQVIGLHFVLSCNIIVEMVLKIRYQIKEIYSMIIVL